MLYNNILETIGNTPIIKLNTLKEKLNLKADVFVKLESFNPGGSVKDRIALNMVKNAIDSGEIDENTTIIEPTSGNTGIGLALVASALNLKLVLVMPSSMSEERKMLIKAFGVKLIYSEPAKGMQGAVDLAQEVAKETENSLILQQFENPNNPKAHYVTGKEILADLPKVDIFLAGIGTGGTVSGVGKVLKEANKDTKIYGIEPATSPVINESKAGPHKIQGIGANFIPKNLDLDILDKVLTVTNEEAIETTRLLALTEGILTGYSSGANLAKAIELAKKEENTGKVIVTTLADNGERYLSTDLYKY